MALVLIKPFPVPRLRYPQAYWCGAGCCLNGSGELVCRMRAFTVVRSVRHLRQWQPQEAPVEVSHVPLPGPAPPD